MKEVTTILWDDLFHSQGQMVPAELEDVELTFNGRTVVLDLCPGSVSEIDSALARFFRAGRYPEPVSVNGEGPGKNGSKRNGQQYFKGLRDWADANGRSGEYTRIGGSISYRKKLKDDYEKYLRETGGSAPV